MKTFTISRSNFDRKFLERSGILILFLYIYSPAIKFIPVNISYLIILCAIAYISIGNNLGKLIQFLQYKPIITFLFFYFFSILYILLVPLFTNGPYDNSFLITYIRLLLDIIIVIPFLVFIFHFELNYSFTDFLNLLVKIGVIQGVIATLMFIIPAIRDFVFTYVMDPPSEKLVRELYRGYGLANDFYFSVPLFQGLIFVVNSILFINTSNKKYLFYYPFILLSMVMNARVTLVVIPIFFLIIFILSFYYDDLKWIQRMSALFIILSILITAIITYFLLNPEKAQSILWIMEGVLGGLGALGGNLSESKTLSIIATEHFHFPHHSYEVLFGEGLMVFGNPHSPVRSDLGYIRYIYYGGITLSILFYFSIINLSINRIKRTSAVLVKALILSLLVITFLVHFKGDIFNSSAYLKGYFLILIYTFYGQPDFFDKK